MFNYSHRTAVIRCASVMRALFHYVKHASELVTRVNDINCHLFFYNNSHNDCETVLCKTTRVSPKPGTTRRINDANN